MTEIFNHKDKTSLRKLLRKNIPLSEKLLWKKLKGKNIAGYKFRRQYGVGKYVVDFCSPRLKLVIEIDGANHFFDNESIGYDINRQKYIESLGLRVLRFTNTDICNDINSVLDVIYDNLPPPPPS